MTLTAPRMVSGSSETIRGAPTAAKEMAYFQFPYKYCTYSYMSMHVLLGPFLGNNSNRFLLPIQIQCIPVQMAAGQMTIQWHYF